MKNKIKRTKVIILGIKTSYIPLFIPPLIRVTFKASLDFPIYSIRCAFSLPLSCPLTGTVCKILGEKVSDIDITEEKLNLSFVLTEVFMKNCKDFY